MGGIKDVGAIHTRLAQGFVTDTKLAGDTCPVTFANGFVAQKRIVTIDDELRRFVYHSVGGNAAHHNGFFQVFAVADDQSKILWVTDLLPDAAKKPIEQMVELGAVAIQRTLEAAFRTR